MTESEASGNVYTSSRSMSHTREAIGKVSKLSQKAYKTPQVEASPITKNATHML